jgi:2-polyprenyl-3-methyl-5-hydroxy-6-metoxy-1,4-benzoquinol methylase
MLSLKEIHELSAGIEYHLKSLEDYTEQLKEVKLSLDHLKDSRTGEMMWEIKKLRVEIDELKGHLKRYGLQEASEYEISLKLLKEQLDSEIWPPAVEGDAICETDEQLFSRAEGILDLVVSENLQGRKFLDFGCGEGHVVSLAHQRGAQAVGYDLDLSKCKFEEPLFNQDFEIIRQHGHYDVILLHDVLDHIQGVDPLMALQQVKSVLAPNGRVYIRNHPWSARHGGHLYNQVNKAFLHLIFDDVELTRICGCQAEHNIKVNRPFDTYRFWFQEVGLDIKSEIAVRREVEQFFIQPSQVQQRLAEKWEDPMEMIKDMEIEFIEYILEDTNRYGTVI